MIVKCPRCGTVFEVEDAHRPAHCPKCHAVLSFQPPTFQPVVMYTAEELVGRERA